MASRTRAGRRIFIAAILARRRHEPSGQRLAFETPLDERRAAFPRGRMHAIPRGTGNQGREARRLRHGKAARADAEERVRRGLAPVGRLADGDRGLASLPPPRAFAGEPQVLRELLRERRGAPEASPAVPGVGPVPCAGGPDRVPVDATVLEEARVLGGEDGADEDGRHLGERHRAAVDRVAPALPAKALLSRADERGRRGIAPAQEKDRGEGDEDEKGKEKEKKKEIS